jgi:HK97 family phage prohead protease
MNDLLITNGTITNADFKDIPENHVKFYFANFTKKDSHGRIMAPTAFNRTLKNNRDKIYHLLNHDDNQIVGKPVEFGTDDYGAWALSRLVNTEKGKETLQLYRDGVYKYASFGFYIKNSHDENGTEVVDEAHVVEVSTVLYPANDMARTIDVNGIIEHFERNNKTQEVLDKINYLIETLNIEQVVNTTEELKKLIISVKDQIARLPVEQQHQTPQEKVDYYAELNDFINNYYERT